MDSDWRWFGNAGGRALQKRRSDRRSTDNGFNNESTIDGRHEMITSSRYRPNVNPKVERSYTAMSRGREHRR